MKKITFICIIALVISLFVAKPTFAQEDDYQRYIVGSQVKIYEQPTKFSKFTLVEAGTIIFVDQYFNNPTFRKLKIDSVDGQEGYILTEVLTGTEISAAVIDNVAQGDGTTASARGSVEGDTKLSLSSVDLRALGNIADVNLIEVLSFNVNVEKWELFRKEGKIGEYYTP